MQTRQVAVTASLLFLAALAVAPTAQAAASASLLSSCSNIVVGTSVCTFTCGGDGAHITISFFGNGSVAAACGGVAVACSTGLSTSCGGTSTLGTVIAGTGVCNMSGIGAGSCGA